MQLYHLLYKAVNGIKQHANMSENKTKIIRYLGKSILSSEFIWMKKNRPNENFNVTVSSYDGH